MRIVTTPPLGPAVPFLLALAVSASGSAARAQEKEETVGEKEKLPAAVVALRAKADALWESAMDKYRGAGGAANKKVAEQLRVDVVALFDEIVKLGKDSGKYGIARFNAALVAEATGPRGDAEALRRLAELVRSDVDDKDPTGELMRPFRNYRFHAWQRSMAIHRRRGETFAAFDALFCSRAAYVTHCSTCQAGMEEGFGRTLDDLCLDVLHGAARKDLDEARTAAEKQIVHAALQGAADAKAFVAALAERLKDSGRAKESESLRKLLPPATPAEGKRGDDKR